MNIRHIAARIALVAVTATAPMVTYAKTPLHVYGANQPAAAGQKLITMSIKNTASEARTVRIADENVTLQPNQVHEFKAPVNTAITAVGDSSNHKDGDLIVKISASMNGVVCSFS